MSTEPYLLTPGPLTTSLRTKQSMLRDWGSWDGDFNSITGRVRERLLQIVHGSGTHECVPMQGSGTFSVEAAIGTLVPRTGHVLVPQNGAYCQRIARICRVLGRKLTTIDYAENTQVAAADIERALRADPSITHVALVHCETSTGILNPLEEIAQAVSRHDRGGLVARGARYAQNCRTLIEGMARLGLKSFLPAAIQAPIIVTFFAPDSPRYVFKDFYNAVKAHGYILYPGKLTTVETFRVGCMGQLGERGIAGAVEAVGKVLAAIRAAA